MKVALDARVSTESQDPEVQLTALQAHVANRGWQVAGKYVDHGYSGARERRPALDRLTRAAWAGEFQAVVVWRFAIETVLWAYAFGRPRDFVKGPSRPPLYRARWPSAPGSPWRRCLKRQPDRRSISRSHLGCESRRDAGEPKGRTSEAL